MKKAELSPKDVVTRFEELVAQGIVTEAHILYHRCNIEGPKVINLIDQMFASDGSTQTTVERGRKVEALAAYLLDASGFFSMTAHDLKNDQHQLDHTGDFDLPYSERLRSFGIELCGFLGESKNYPEKKIDVNIVYKVEALKLFTQSGVGCYFARDGFTGSSELEAGKALMKDFYQKFKTISIIFTDKDWKILKKYPKLFPGLFFEKIKLFKKVYNSEISDYEKIINLYKKYI